MGTSRSTLEVMLMSLMSFFSRTIVMHLLNALFVACGLCGTAHAQMRLTPVVHRPPVLDLALGRTGVLSGQFLDHAGRPSAGARVLLWHGKKLVDRVVTDNNGQFSFTDLSGGVYRVECNGQVLDCRVWTPDLAPPQSKDLLVLIRHESASRGAVDFVPPGPTAITSALTSAALSVFSNREIRSPNSP
jgi:hypothetical protein